MHSRPVRTCGALLWLAAVCSLLPGCQREPAPTAAPATRIGVLLVNHGSRSKAWRDRLVDMEQGIAQRVLAIPHIGSVKTAFNEYTEPSVATRMKEFDDEGFGEVIVVPLFLSTANAHVYDDVAVGVGLRNNTDIEEELPNQGIPVYRPRARATMLKTIDETGFLRENIERRVRSLLADDDPDRFGVTMGAYGSEPFRQQWEHMLSTLGRHLTDTLGIDTVNYAWSGHVVNYSVDPTRKAINQVLAQKDEVIVVSIYLSYDRKFLGDIIGEAVRRSDRPGDVRYNETESILPDPHLSDWVVESIEGALAVGRLGQVTGAGAS